MSVAPFCMKSLSAGSLPNCPGRNSSRFTYIYYISIYTYLISYIYTHILYLDGKSISIYYISIYTHYMSTHIIYMQPSSRLHDGFSLRRGKGRLLVWKRVLDGLLELQVNESLGRMVTRSD